MNVNSPAIVFSVDRADRAEGDNLAARRLAEKALRERSIPFADAIGRYDGTLERAYIVRDSGRALETVRRLTAWNSQESILRVDANGRARLETPRGDYLTTLGHLVAVPRTVAEREEAYTETDGRFFITR